MTVENCKFCGVELNALNISEVEPKCCGDCCDAELDKILRFGEDD